MTTNTSYIVYRLQKKVEELTNEIDNLRKYLTNFGGELNTFQQSTNTTLSTLTNNTENLLQTSLDIPTISTESTQSTFYNRFTYDFDNTTTTAVQINNSNVAANIINCDIIVVFVITSTDTSESPPVSTPSYNITAFNGVTMGNTGFLSYNSITSSAAGNISGSSSSYPVNIVKDSSNYYIYLTTPPNTESINYSGYLYSVTINGVFPYNLSNGLSSATISGSPTIVKPNN